MPAALPALAAVATVVSVGATVYGIKQQQEAAEAQEEANEISQRQNQLQQQENIRKAVAASRVARAQAEAMGAGAGASVATTSGAAGAETSGTAGNVGFAIGMNKMQNQRFDALIDANRAGNRASTAQGFADLAGAASGFGGGLEGLANVANYYSTPKEER